MTTEPTTREAMSAPPVTVDPDATAATAAEVLAAAGVGALAVCSGDGEPVGMVTDRDVVIRLVAQEAEPAETAVGELAETPAVTADARDPLSATAAKMARHGLRRLPVLDGGRLVGVVSRGDVLRSLPPSAARTLHEAGNGHRSSDDRSAAWLFERSYA